jgi:RimJ/RimL family protein N-acetyltransferase
MTVTDQLHERSSGESGPDLSLTPAGPEHAQFWHAIRQEDRAIEFNPMDQLTLEQLRERLRQVGSDPTDSRQNDLRWMVIEHRDQADQLVGTVHLAVNRRMQHAEVGYHIGSEHYGRGIGRIAVYQLLELAFAEATGIQRLFAFIAERNIASIRLVERLGFQREGVLREHYQIGDRLVTEVVYGLLRREWVANRSD